MVSKKSTRAITAEELALRLCTLKASVLCVRKTIEGLTETEAQIAVDALHGIASDIGWVQGKLDLCKLSPVGGECPALETVPDALRGWNTRREVCRG